MDSGEAANTIEIRWARVRGRLRSEVGEAAFKSWLKPLTLRRIDGDVVRLTVGTRFMRDWVASHYGDRLRELWREEDGSIGSIEIAVADTGAEGDCGAAEPARARHAGPVVPGLPRREAARPTTGSLDLGPGETFNRDIGAPLDPRFTFENFVVGKSNEMAHAAALRVADATTLPFNPLFLYGGVGLGKTHLMHAIAHRISTRKPDKRVIYLSAENFMYRFVRAMRYKDTMSFKEQFRAVDFLMIDDIQFFSGKDSTQEEFFHTFNALVDENRQVVISADKPPFDLQRMDERLRSRLGWGLVADIHPTTYELRLSILQSKADQLRVDMPPKVLEFLAHKITSNVRELEGALNRIVAHSELIGREITLENTQELLHDLLRASDRHITIDEIQKRVAEHFNIRLSDMHSPRRARAVARPRQVAMYLAKQLTTRSLPEIGRKFGGRDHTTVMHAVKRIDQLRATDASFAEDIDLLRRMVEG